MREERGAIDHNTSMDVVNERLTVLLIGLSGVVCQCA
jgi:hypothetical protein